MASGSTWPLLIGPIVVAVASRPEFGRLHRQVSTNEGCLTGADDSRDGLNVAFFLLFSSSFSLFRRKTTTAKRRPTCSPVFQDLCRPLLVSREMGQSARSDSLSVFVYLFYLLNWSIDRAILRSSCVWIVVFYLFFFLYLFFPLRVSSAKFRSCIPYDVMV